MAKHTLANLITKWNREMATKSNVQPKAQQKTQLQIIAQQKKDSITNNIDVNFKGSTVFINGDQKRAAKAAVKAKLNHSTQPGTFQLMNLVDLIPISTQRQIDVQWAEKALEERNGFDLTVFNSMSVGYDKVQNKNFVYDGLGRKMIATIAEYSSPLPCMVHNLTEKECAERFAFINGDGMRSVKPDERFINEFESGDIDAIAKEKVLSYIDCYIGERLTVPKILPCDNLNVRTGAQISIGTLKTVMGFIKKQKSEQQFAYKNVKLAKQMIKTAYPNDEVLAVDLFLCVMVLLHHTTSHADIQSYLLYQGNSGDHQYNLIKNICNKVDSTHRTIKQAKSDANVFIKKTNDYCKSNTSHTPIPYINV